MTIAGSRDDNQVSEYGVCTLNNTVPLTGPAFRGQHGEDKYIAGLIPEDCAKVFVDVGANDGYSWSNSHYFGEIGYKVVLIEPMPRYATFCRQLYSMNPRAFVEEYAISSDFGAATFYVHDNTEIDLLAMGSSLEKAALPSAQMTEIQVMTAPLSFFLEKYEVPERYAVLGVDAEGCDLVVLQTAKLDKWRPRVICVEEGRNAEGIRPYLESMDYRFIEKLAGVNGIYVPRAN